MAPAQFKFNLLEVALEGAVVNVLEHPAQHIAGGARCEKVTVHQADVYLAVHNACEQVVRALDLWQWSHILYDRNPGDPIPQPLLRAREGPCALEFHYLGQQAKQL